MALVSAHRFPDERDKEAPAFSSEGLNLAQNEKGMRLTQGIVESGLAVDGMSPCDVERTRDPEEVWIVRQRISLKRQRDTYSPRWVF